jgi:hypothetical protein
MARPIAPLAISRGSEQSSLMSIFGLTEQRFSHIIAMVTGLGL